MKVSCGAMHSAIVTAAGELWTVGGNDFGQLGNLEIFAITI